MKKRSEFVIGSRGSELALWQARWVQGKLAGCHPHLKFPVEVIRTTGDNVLDAPLSKIGDKGLFTREIEHALLDRRIDLAVHSLKDLPTALPSGLVIGAITVRADVRDVFIPHPENPRRTISAQRAGAIIATGSLRRKSQLLHARPDLQIVDIRGNLATRLKKLDESNWDGMVLAHAGVSRLGLNNRIGELIEPDVILPAVGQGALAIEVREEDEETPAIVRALHNLRTAQVVLAERSLLRELEGGCQIPIGALGEVTRRGENVHVLTLTGFVGSLDGTRVLRASIEGEPWNCELLGRRLAETLISAGADKILQEIRASQGAVLSEEMQS